MEFIKTQAGKLARYGAVFIGGWLTNLGVQHDSAQLEALITGVVLALVSYAYSAIKKP